MYIYINNNGIATTIILEGLPGKMRKRYSSFGSTVDIGFSCFFDLRAIMVAIYILQKK